MFLYVQALFFRGLSVILFMIRRLGGFRRVVFAVFFARGALSFIRFVGVFMIGGIFFAKSGWFCLFWDEIQFSHGDVDTARNGFDVFFSHKAQGIADTDFIHCANLFGTGDLADLVVDEFIVGGKGGFFYFCGQRYHNGGGRIGISHVIL